MALESGTRLGAYEIVGPLGAGGMGEVYRARDTKLNRDVALKVLPADFTHDPERVARFTREAQALASLNHPHIAQIYGLAEADADTAEPHARPAVIVMEFVDGESLDQRIARGPVPLDEATPVALQIADALEAAHDKGIVHRDLKPANIVCTHDGQVKVLDFGLAKSLESAPHGSSAGFTQSPTITTPAMMTGVGVILGTAAYMAPEQAKGRPADKRSDVWAFGCVFFEMLTGRRPFDGDDVGDVLDSILKTEPDWTRLPASTPTAVRRLIRECLTKDRLKRPAHIAVAQFVLRGGGDAIALPTDGSRPGLRRTIAPPAALAAAVGLIAGLAWMAWKRPMTSPTVAHFTVPVGVGSALGVGARPLLAFAPDGKKFVYIANGTMFLRPLSQFDAQQIVVSESNDAFAGALSHPVFSPDSQSIAFYSLIDSAIKRVPIGGGGPITLCRADNPFGMSWTGDTIVFGAGRDGVFRVPATGGTPQQIAKVDADEIADTPSLLPDGSLLFTLAKGLARDRWDKAHIVVQSVDRQRKTIIEGGSDARYLPTGHLLYAIGGTVFAVGFDAARHATTGTPTPVVEGVRRSLSAGSGVAQIAVSSSGSMAYIAGPLASGIQRSLVFSDDHGGTSRLPLAAGQYQHPRVSRNGKTLAVEKDDGSDADVWIYDLSGSSQMRRLTFGGHNRFPVWAGDGQRIAFQSDRDGDTAIFVQRADVSGATAQRLTRAAPGEVHMPESWSPDNRTLFYTVLKDGTFTLFLLTVDSGKAEAFGVTSAEPIGATFSPDGRWVAYAQNDRPGGTPSPNRGVYVQPFPPNGERYQVPKQRLDFHPAWGSTSEQLFFVPTVGRFLLVTLQMKPTLTFTSAVERAVSVSHDRVSTEIRDFDVMPDGRLLLTTVGDERGVTSLAAPQLRVVLNWTEELKQRVPTR
jgi:eukaryotic-like serine/threonine-protein kinase